MKMVKLPLIPAAKLLLGLAILLTFGTLSCSRNSAKLDSILVIGVDGLSFSDINCLDSHDSGKSGFQILCQEGVRFSHAYTTSTLATPSVASLLTGLYPIEHGLRHNGAQSVNATLIPREAAKLGYRTSFFSGGPPLLRRSGLQDGFEVFNDSMFISFNSFNRPIQSSVRLFKNWLTEINGQSFFTFLYSSDLSHPDLPTTTDSGESRILSIESQIQEVDESLFDLFTELKKRNQWDNTVIVLAGLNGRPAISRLREFSATNLHSEMTQVALLIKPYRKKADAAMSWKVDRNVSLSDVGATIYKLLTKKMPEIQISELPRVDLTNVLSEAEPNWSEDRLILTESAWDNWKNNKEIRYSLRSDQYLFIWDQAPKLFNTLIDRFESSETPLDSNHNKESTVFFNFMKQANWPRYSQPSVNEIRKLQLQFPQEFSSAKSWSDFGVALNTLAIGLPNDEEISNYLAYFYFWTQDWQGLRKLGQKWKKSEWIFAAEKNLKLKPSVETPPCFANFVKASNKTEARKCVDTIVTELYDWTQSEQAKKRFFQAYNLQKLNLLFTTLNYNLGQPLDMSTKKGTAPPMVDLVLSLPEMHKYRATTSKTLEDQEQRFEDL